LAGCFSFDENQFYELSKTFSKILCAIAWYFSGMEKQAFVPLFHHSLT